MTRLAITHAEAATRSDAELELVDLADHQLPLLDEPMPPALVAAGRGEYGSAVTERVIALSEEVQRSVRRSRRAALA